MFSSQSQNISPQLLNLISQASPPIAQIKQFLRKLIKQLKHPSPQSESDSLLKQTLHGIANILKDNNTHPKIKFNSHKVYSIYIYVQTIMYLLLLADLDVYDAFLETIYPIIRVNCLYNKGVKLEIRGEQFFKKSRYFTDSKTTPVQKNQIKKYGCQYIIFCLETVYQLAKWLPFDLQQDTKPTKFSVHYQGLKKQKVQFPKQADFKFYVSSTLDQIQRVIKQVQSQFQSILDSDIKSNSIMQLNVVSKPAQINNNTNTEIKKAKQSQNKKSNQVMQSPPNYNYNYNNNYNQMQQNNKIFLLQDQKNKLLKEIQIQRKYFQNQLEKQKQVHQDKIFRYEKKISGLQQQIERMKQKLGESQAKFLSTQPNSKTYVNSNDKNKDKMIEDAQSQNKILAVKIQKLQQEIKKYEEQKKNFIANSQASYASLVSEQLQKLKKQNKSLKAKLLTQCQEPAQFNPKKNNARKQKFQKQPQSLKFINYEEARASFEPFYSNSPSDIKNRLRKAILRQKQLLYKDKIIQIGCIARLESINTIKLTTIFTNVSQKPLYNFSIDYVLREDLTVKLTQTPKNYLQITGQTKSQILVTVNQIDFRCLLCSVRFNLQQQMQKVALIMPISKFKLAQQLVYTPITKQERLKKIEKVFQYEKRLLPNLHKFKQFFDSAILEVDRTNHETYNVKMQFMNAKFYVQCGQIEGELRIAVKYYEDQDYSKAQKLLQEIVFLFSKN